MSTKPSNRENAPSFVLRADRIRPGDVLLSFGGGFLSQQIVKSSGPPELRDSAKGFSHAALCVNDYLTYESDGELIGSRLIYPLAVHLGDEHSSMVDCPRYSLAPDNPPRFQLLRHPRMPVGDPFLNIVPEAFSRAYQQLLDQTFGADYSRMSRLAKLADSDLVRKLLCSTYAFLDDNLTGRKKVYASFCSELVAQFFEFIGLPLFRESRRPEHVAPNDLGDSKLCYLEAVPDAVATWPPRGPFEIVNREENAIWQRFRSQEDDSAELAHEFRLRSLDYDKLFATLKSVVS